MCFLVAHQGARLAVVRNRQVIIASHDIHVETHKRTAADARSSRRHAMRTVAYGTRKSLLNMPAMCVPPAHRVDVVQIVTLRAERVRRCRGGVQNRIRIEINNQRSGRGSSPDLADYILAFQNMIVYRSVRSIRPRTAKLTVIIVVVAIRA